MQPVPVQRSRMRRGVSGVRAPKEGSDKMRCARWVVHASVSGLLAASVSGDSFLSGECE